MTSYPVGPKAKHAVVWRTCESRPADGADMCGLILAAVSKGVADGKVAEAIRQRFPGDPK